MTNPVTQILQEELETVTEALSATGTFVLEGEERDQWTDRLHRVSKALAAHVQTVYLTETERATLLTLIEFHDGAFGPNEEAPFDTHAAESARAKLQG